MTNATRIYRNLSLPLLKTSDLRETIYEWLNLLKENMPVDGVTIQTLEPSLKSTRSIIWCSITEVFPEMIQEIFPDTIIPMPREVRHHLKDNPLPNSRIINNFENDPVGEYFIPISGNDLSAIVMFLSEGGKRFGAVALVAAGKNRYTREDLELFSQLKEPLAMALKYHLLGQENLKLQNILSERDDRTKQRVGTKDIIGSKFGLRNVMNMVHLISSLDSPVLITGETGVGKELIANAIHDASPRRDGPLISVNCGAIPETIVDSELFGHEKGAFTGAVTQRKGRFERAHQGTIFLDEIGELRPEIQVKLLRVLQNGEIERVGGSEQIKVDVRVIAATHRNLEKMVSEKRFREDLLFRINVFPIVIPPLRGRTQDIPALVDYFIRKKCEELKIQPLPSLDRNAIDKLTQYPWPGNVRELENIVERELILYDGSPLAFNTLLSNPKKGLKKERHSSRQELLPLDEVMIHHIKQVLNETNGRISGPKGAAKILGLHPNTLRNRMKKLGILYKKKDFQ